jgi:hypothetical protein
MAFKFYLEDLKFSAKVALLDFENLKFAGLV